MAASKKSADATSVAGYLEAVMAAGLRLIPLDIGAKTTHEHKWSERGESDLSRLVQRASALWQTDPTEAAEAMHGTPLYAWIEALPGFGYGFGNLHEAAGTVCLDLDHPMALAALQAGVEAIGGPSGYLPTSGASWESVRGRKWLWRVPADLKGRSVRVLARHRDAAGAVTASTVLELRGTGQDMVPYSYRADAGRVLAWDSYPIRVEPLPKPIDQLMRALLADDKSVATAMQLAAGTPRDLVGLDSTHVDDYPPRLSGAMRERHLVNAHLDVADILAAHGYRQSGRRWGPPGASHADGITQPADNRKHWHSFHEGDPLCGQFDAWRAFVTLEYNGDLAAAKAAALALPAPLKLASGGEKGEKVRRSTKKDALTASSYKSVPPDEKMRQRSTIASGEIPAKRIKNASSELSTGEGTTPPATRQEANQRDLPAKGAKRAAKRAKGSDDKSVEPESGEPVAAVLVDSGPDPEGAGELEVDDAPDPDLIDLDELDRETIAPPRLLLDGRLKIPMGTYLLAGAPKAGKSWLALGLSLALAGRLDRILESAAVAPSPGLYIMVDDRTRRRVKERTEHLRRDGRGRPGEKWYAATAWPLQGYEHHDRIEALDQWLSDHPEVRHVVIDTLVAWRSGEREQAVVQQEYTEVRELQEVARKHGVLLLVVHYTNKGASKRNFDWDDPFMSIAGTTAQQGAADGMLVIHRAPSGDDGEQLGAIWFSTRDLEVQECAAQLAAPSGRWEWLAASAEAIRTLDVRRAVLEHLLALAPSAYESADDIRTAVVDAGAIDVPKGDSFRRLLSRMKHEGLLDSRSGSQKLGGYRLSDVQRVEMKARKF